MKTILKISFLFLLLTRILPLSAQDLEKYSQYDIQLPKNQNGIIYQDSEWWDGEDVMFWKTGKAGNQLHFKIPEGKLKPFKYLICELYHSSDYSLRVGFNFFRDKSNDSAFELQSGESTSQNKRRPVLGVKIGVIPHLKTNVVFPLSHLDAQQVFLKRYPRQLKGTIGGSRLAIENVSSFSIEINPYKGDSFKPELQIKRLYFSDTPPEPLDKPQKKVVDEFGQWAAKEYKGKVTDQDDLLKQVQKLEEIAANASFPDHWSQYGGWKEKIFDPSGYFYVKKEKGKWWMVDPDGFGFVSVGIDCVRPNSAGWIEGQEDIFEWLPKGDSEFNECYGISRKQKMFDFFQSNLIRVYGENWKQKWNKITTGLLKEFGINTIGNWSDMDFIKQAKLPYVFPMSQFPTTKTMLYRDFPDVFSDEYSINAVKFAKQLEPLKNDKYMIGYFLRNEPLWAFGKNNIAYEMFAVPTKSDSKNEFVRWIQKRYNNLSEFNSAWKISIHSFRDLSNQVFLEMPSAVAQKDFWDFSKILVRKYVDVPCDEVEKVDNNHLNLGMRYAWISSELLYEAGERFDVFSINGYRVPLPPETDEVHKKSGNPIMIGEFHFGAIDRGLPSTGITGVKNQEERGKAYRSYVENGLLRDELIGVHYFQYLDQPVFGRFDGENYNIGVLSITHIPYQEKVDAMKKTNLNIYDIVSGRKAPFNKKVEVIPSIFF